MIDNFEQFGFYHILSILIAISIGLFFIALSLKSKNVKKVSIYLVISIIVIRSVRYIFDMYIGDFNILDLVSLHVCHINLILLIICLFKPNRNLFVFNFLIGIPTALSVILMPGSTHMYPGLLRAMFFIMSHTMLIMGTIYLLINYKFYITKKDLFIYYVVSFVGIVIVYIFDYLTNSNFMYLLKSPNNLVLDYFYQYGQFYYLFFIYLLLIALITAMYYLNKYVVKLIK
ncbi:MAG: YwaF family protein [Bacilli bacterium]|nr:YwaF family protein [Bacilli bacterium]